MPQAIQALVGQVPAATGVPTQNLRADNTSALVTTDAHGRYMEEAIRGNIFTACNVAAQALTVALATTYTGLCVSNPTGSLKNLVILGCNFAQTAAPSSFAALFIGAGGSAAGIVTHTTPLAAPGIQRSIIGAASGVALSSNGSVANADSACTLVNPYYAMALSPANATGTLPVASQPGWVDLGGLLVVQPGGWVAIIGLTVATGFGTFVWAEIPINPA